MPRRVEKIVQRCLEYEPELRYANAGEIERDLARLLGQQRLHSALLVLAIVVVLSAGVFSLALHASRAALSADLSFPSQASYPINSSIGDMVVVYVGRKPDKSLRIGISSTEEIETGEVVLQARGKDVARGIISVEDREARLSPELLSSLEDGEYSVRLRLEGPSGRNFSLSPRSIVLSKDTSLPRLITDVSQLNFDAPHFRTEHGLYVGSDRFQIKGRAEDNNLLDVRLRDPEGGSETDPISIHGDAFSIPLTVEVGSPKHYEIVLRDRAHNEQASERFWVEVRRGELPIDLTFDGVELERIASAPYLPIHGDALDVAGRTREDIPLTFLEVVLNGRTHRAEKRDLSIATGASGRHALLSMPIEHLEPFVMHELSLSARDALGRTISRSLMVRRWTRPNLALEGYELETEAPGQFVYLKESPARIRFQAHGAIVTPGDGCTIRIRDWQSAWRLETAGTDPLLSFEPALPRDGEYELSITLTDSLGRVFRLPERGRAFLLLDSSPPEIRPGSLFRVASETFHAYLVARNRIPQDTERSDVWVVGAQRPGVSDVAPWIGFVDDHLLGGTVDDAKTDETLSFRLRLHSDGTTSPEETDASFLFNGRSGEMRFTPRALQQVQTESEIELDIALWDRAGHRQERKLFIFVDRAPPSLEIEAPAVVKTEGSSKPVLRVRRPRIYYAEHEEFPLELAVRDQGTGVARILVNGQTFEPVGSDHLTLHPKVAGRFLTLAAEDYAGNISEERILEVLAQPPATVRWNLLDRHDLLRLVPSGVFIMGNSLPLETSTHQGRTPLGPTGTEAIPSQPEKAVSLSYDIYMSENEITNAQFAEFIRDGGYEDDSHWDLSWDIAQQSGELRRVDFESLRRSPEQETLTAIDWRTARERRRLFKDAGDGMGPASWEDGRYPKEEGPDHPVTHVSFLEAMAYCRWMGSRLGVAGRVRLPNELEWEAAARLKGDLVSRSGEEASADGVTRRFPWGEHLDPDAPFCNYAHERKAPVGQYERDLSALGIRNLSGNVSEWVIPYPAHYIEAERKPWWRGVHRGGSFEDLEVIYCTSFVHRDAGLLDRSRSRGFRCVIEAEQLPEELKRR